MHALEHVLLILSARIRHETGNEELAEAAGMRCAGIPEGEEMLSKMNDDWERRYGKLLIAKE